MVKIWNPDPAASMYGKVLIQIDEGPVKAFNTQQKPSFMNGILTVCDLLGIPSTIDFIEER